ncbi:uncharacterized protein LOC129312730 [Prosopis cineraria]|uniref:uncharacterized protein LOC129312730 n=1 Tax=Prosopis cineraria TaxID=364024 RepID=UPI002410506C|nr:uncharacterized protein LOC129312730 [Prosopis cineraria]XP_054811388.1 uncharacterized protein LOC129312730 [Prosopis cineraria]
MSNTSHSQKPIVKVEAFLDEQIKSAKVPEEMEVDIVSWTNKVDFASNKNDDPDATEHSSSFADTTSDPETSSRLSEAEVESELLGDSGLTCAFDAFGSCFPMRKKKLTDHWRSFIRPLMWRCKWTELRIKEMESQALKYSKELVEFNHRKCKAPDQLTLEEIGSKSLPFTRPLSRSKAKKRRKRKQIEDTIDIGSYMSRHYLFSYLENKKSDPDGSLADDFGNPVIADPHTDLTDRFRINDDQSFFDFSDGDGSLEQLLWTIENVHSRVHKLKTQVDLIMSKNALKFSSSENLSLLLHGDVQTSSAHSPAFSAGNGDTVSAGAICNSAQHAPEFDFGDLVMPDSAVSSYGEATAIPDIIESTVGLLSATDVNATLPQPQTVDSCEDMVDNVLTHNETAEAEEHAFKSVNHNPTEKHLEAGKGGHESAHTASLPMTESNIAVKSALPHYQEQSTLKSCLYKDVHFPNIKRKRGERKAGSGGWSKKCSGEPDSQ